MSFVSDKFNESFILEEGYQYRGYDITISRSDSSVYIRDGKGELVGKASSDSDAEEYIDDLLDEEEDRPLKTFEIKYLTNEDRYVFKTVEASDAKEAESILNLPRNYKIIYIEER